MYKRLWLLQQHSLIVGGAWERIFQPLCNQIDRHIPSCTAVVRHEEHAPNHTTAKAYIPRYQALRLALKPGRILAPSRLLQHLREGAYVRKFAEPSDDLHHIACLSSVRACCGLRLQPRYCGRPSLPGCYSHVSLACACSLSKTYPASPRLSSNQTVTQIVCNKVLLGKCRHGAACTEGDRSVNQWSYQVGEGSDAHGQEP
jgi:hypothetical protein